MFSTTATSYMLIIRVYVHNPLMTQIPKEREREEEKERERECVYESVWKVWERKREKEKTSERKWENVTQENYNEKIWRSDKCKQYIYIYI